MNKFTCKHENCLNTKHKGFGYCRKHQVQFKRLGKTLKYSYKDFYYKK